MVTSTSRTTPMESILWPTIATTNRTTIPIPGYAIHPNAVKLCPSTVISAEASDSLPLILELWAAGMAKESEVATIAGPTFLFSSIGSI